MSFEWFEVYTREKLQKYFDFISVVNRVETKYQIYIQRLLQHNHIMTTFPDHKLKIKENESSIIKHM